MGMDTEWKAVPSRSGASWSVESGLRVVASGLSRREARLIAAAPKMYEAAKNALDLIESMTEHGGRVSFMNNCDQVRELRAALASIDAP